MLKYNSKVINRPYYNGTALDKVFYNDTQVYNYGLVSISYYYTGSKSSSTSSITFSQYITVTINGNYYTSKNSSGCPIIEFRYASTSTYITYYQTENSRTYTFTNTGSLLCDLIALQVGIFGRTYSLDMSSLNVSYYTGF